MQKDETEKAVSGNLEVKPAPSGINREERRERDKFKKSSKGFKITVGMMYNHLNGIKNHLNAVIADGEAAAEEMEPAIKELDRRLTEYNKFMNWGGIPGAVPPLKIRQKKIFELIKDFDTFMYEIEQESKKAAEEAAESEAAS